MNREHEGKRQEAHLQADKVMQVTDREEQAKKESDMWGYAARQVTCSIDGLRRTDWVVPSVCEIMQASGMKWIGRQHIVYQRLRFGNTLERVTQDQKSNAVRDLSVSAMQEAALARI